MVTFSPYTLAVVALCSGAAHAIVSSSIDRAAETAQQGIEGGTLTGSSPDPISAVIGFIKGLFAGSTAGAEYGYDMRGTLEGAMAGGSAGAVAGGVAGSDLGYAAGSTAGAGAGALINADDALEHHWDEATDALDEHYDAATDWVDDNFGDFEPSFNWTAGWNNISNGFGDAIGLIAGTTTTIPPSCLERFVGAIGNVFDGIMGKRSVQAEAAAAGAGT